MSNLYKKIFFIFKRRHFVFLLTLATIVILFIASLAWWKIKIQYFKDDLNEIIEDFANDIAKFDDYFLPKHFVSITVEGEQKYKQLTQEDTSELKDKPMDTALYYLLWDKYIAEYGFEELDSLTIDSIVKKTMETYALDTISISTKQDIKETQQIKKEELKGVELMIPSLFVSDTVQGAVKQLNMQFNVEFWDSPLNLSGAKVVGNIITLYGIKKTDAISLQYDPENGNLYLKYNNALYLLERDGKLHQFSKLVKVK